MEAVVIKINGRQVCKLVDEEKVAKAKELQAYWKQAQIEISKKYFQKIEVL